MNFIGDISKIKSIGEDVFIDKDARIVRPHLVKIGDHVAIDMCTYVSTQLEIGDYVHIAPHVSIIGGEKCKLIMGHFSNIGSGSKVVCGSNDFNVGMIGPLVPQEYTKTTYSTITFEEHSSVGVNCVVMPGITLAEGSVVGANSVVTKDTEPWTIYVGSPAKSIKKREKENIIKNAAKMGYQ